VVGVKKRLANKNDTVLIYKGKEKKREILGNLQSTSFRGTGKNLPLQEKKGKLG